MGRRGYLSSLGASAALAAAAALALLLASLYVSFNGWPGLRESVVRSGAVQLAEQAEGSAARGRPLHLRARSAGRGPAPRRKARPTESRQGIKGTERSRSARAQAPGGSARGGPSPAQPPSRQAPPAAGAEDPVGQALDGAGAVLQETGETVPRLVDPAVGPLDEALAGAGSVLDR